MSCAGYFRTQQVPDISEPVMNVLTIRRSPEELNSVLPHFVDVQYHPRQPDDHVSWPLCSGLHKHLPSPMVGMHLDTTAIVSFVIQQDLDRLGMTCQELFQKALCNLVILFSPLIF